MVAEWGSLRLFLIALLVFQPGANARSQCSEKVADIVFVLDSSFSIWPKQFQTQLAFVSDLVDSFTIGPNNIRVGVVTFSTGVRLDVALNEHTQKRGLQRAIGQIEYMKGATRTGDAIRFAHKEMFKPERGGRLWAAHMVILITDGFSARPDVTSLEASVARSKGMELFAIGVGGGVDETELRAIASDPDDSHMFRVDTYDALGRLDKVLTSKTCQKANTNDSTVDETEEPANQKDMAVKRCTGKQADVFVLLDGSSSLLKTEFQQQLHFAARLLQVLDVGAGNTRVAAAVYSDDVHDVVAFQHHQSAHSVEKALKHAPYLAGGTNTGDALRYVRTRGFAEARKDAAHVIILLTDGQSENGTQTLLEARRARAQGLSVFAVGVSAQTDVGELMAVASDPDENFVFHVEDFSELEHIRDLLAIKACDVPVPGYQGEQAVSDILFVYDSASASRGESELISEAVRGLVGGLKTDQNKDGDLVRLGLLRGNCYKGDNMDLKPQTQAVDLLALLQKPHHNGLHALLKTVRLHGYMSTRSQPQRSTTRKVIVLFVGTKLTDAVAVETELKRLNYLGVRVLVVAMDTAKDDVTMLRGQASVDPVLLDTHGDLRESREVLESRLCEINQMRD